MNTNRASGVTSATVRSRPATASATVIERRGKFLVAEPFFGSGPRVAVSRDNRFSVGDLVVLGVGRGQRSNGRGRAVIAHRLGRPDVARHVIEGLMLDRGLRRSFDPAVEREAREAAADPPEDRERRDLRRLPTFTIDPVGARDFDDAISARQEPDGSVRVWVHIADVSAFVPPRSLVDREANRRATSVYVPGAVEPMLPAELSNSACSLVPGQDRLTVTVEMTMGAEAGTCSRPDRSDGAGADQARVDASTVRQTAASTGKRRRFIGKHSLESFRFFSCGWRPFAEAPPTVSPRLSEPLLASGHLDLDVRFLPVRVN